MIQRETAYIGLGSNLGDRLSYLYAAAESLHADPEAEVVRCSSVYETAPVGYTEQPYFLNMAIEVRTSLAPLELLELLLATERSLGRVRDIRWGPRTIDLDLLQYGNTSMQTEILELPHPRLRERAFVLIPLLEICESNELESQLASVDGKEDVQLWAKTNWRSESGRFEN